eukprot:CAMPEP_0114572088 /NCGR_PEP_ID=MMETSP0114-20121206/18098_1 /TAXON_ID=31324 /ORGANISM="Goniomonas sp, Strain m" /LENGTH=458 /DNA_ID=CAMNT_0001759261 /DNA_START=24 /DNA_END=1396 /DNA_ORIENTATION=+
MAETVHQPLSSLIQTLEEQSEVLMALIRENHIKKADKSLALPFFRERRLLLTQIEKLKVLAKNPDAQIPSFHLQQRAYTLQRTFPDVALDDIELQIVGCQGLHIPGKDTAPNAFVTFEFAYPSDNVQKIQTPTLTSPNPAFAHIVTLKVGRSKGFERFCERKKLTFDVVHYSTAYFGLKDASEVIGKATLPLAALLNKCEISESLPLVDARRRETGALLDVRIRLAKPLRAEFETQNVVNQKWIVVDDPQYQPPPQVQRTPSLEKAAAPPPQKQQKQQQPQQSKHQEPSQPQQPQQQPSAPAHKPAPPTTAPPPAAAPQPAVAATVPAAAVRDGAAGREGGGAAAGGESADPELADPHNVDFFVSNEVMEVEMAALVRKEEQGELSDEDSMRKLQLQGKMNVLVALIQTGKLSLPVYLDDVKKRIQADTQLALKLKKAGQIADATTVLKRIKIATAEV